MWLCNCRWGLSSPNRSNRCYFSPLWCYIIFVILYCLNGNVDSLPFLSLSLHCLLHSGSWLYVGPSQTQLIWGVCIPLACISIYQPEQHVQCVFCFSGHMSGHGDRWNNQQLMMVALYKAFQDAVFWALVTVWHVHMILCATENQEEWVCQTVWMNEVIFPIPSSQRVSCIFKIYFCMETYVEKIICC